MRQWHVNPKILCRKHLLGEHVEHHMFVGAILKNKSLNGYLEKNLLSLTTLISRHDELAKEMINRGYNHFSELPEFNLNNFSEEELQIKVDINKSLFDLLSRCEECRKNIKE